ncbi:MAG: tetratricopeptide repeat protein [Gammaproteobacteria bacterium]
MFQRCRLRRQEQWTKIIHFAGFIILLLSFNAHAQDQFSQGVELFKQGRYDQAESSFMNALQSEPRSAEIYFYLGLVATQKGEQARAVAAYRKAAKLDPGLDGVHLSMGIAYYKMNLNTLAINSFRRAVKQDPEDASAPFFLGLSYEETGKYQEAIQWFQKAALLDAEFEQLAYFNIGLAQSRSGNIGAAREALNRAVKIDSSSETGKNAQNYLATLDKAATQAKRWYVSANAGIEYDDNVTLSEVDTTTGIGDIAAVFDFSAAYQVYKTNDTEIEVGYDFYQSIYEDLSSFDLQSHLFSAIASREFGNTDGTLSYSYNYLELGGNSFLVTNSIMPSVGTSFFGNMYHTLSYNFKDKEFTDNTARSADQHAVGLDNYYFFEDGKSYGFLNLRYEDEDTAAPQFDYVGYYVTVGAKSTLPIFAINPEVRFNYQYFLRDYQNITPSISQEREDERNTVTFSVTQYFNDNFNIKLNYQYIDSNSNLPTSDYTENIFTATVGASF